MPYPSGLAAWLLGVPLVGAIAVAYGSSLNLDPLVVLLVVTGAGLIGGVALIVLAAPLTATVSGAAGRLADASRAAPIQV